MKLLVILFLTGTFVRWMLKGKEREAIRQVTHELNKGISLRAVTDRVEDDTGKPLTVHRIFAEGSVVVPSENFPARFRTRLFDVTEDANDPFPVFCYLDECTDPNGFFETSNETVIPHQLSSFADLPATVLPTFALHMAKRGQRKIRVYVEILPLGQEAPVLSAGFTTVFLDQIRHGYTEGEVRTAEHDRLLAGLALALCASDGDIDAREVATMRKFFSMRMTDRKNAEQANAQLQAALQAIKQQLATTPSSQLIERFCREIRGGDDADLGQTAYELCVQVVAADDKIEDSERAALADVAQRLGLAESVVQEAHERHFRMSMFGQNAEEQLMGMPDGLTDEQKIEFLNAEYRKWRGRVTHPDEKVRTEATMRLQAITRLRKKLADAVPA